MRAVVQDRLGGAFGGRALTEGCTGVGVRCELRIVAAGDLEADTVATPEFVARRPDLESILIRAAGHCRRRGRQRVPERCAQDAVIQVDTRPSGLATVSLAVKSVSVALDCAHSRADTGPVISVSCSSGAVS